jgi:hypothetical protein
MMISANPTVDVIQRALVSLLLPGLLGAAAFAGNIHAYSLGPAAIINFCSNSHWLGF